MYFLDRLGDTEFQFHYQILLCRCIGLIKVIYIIENLDIQVLGNFCCKQSHIDQIVHPSYSQVWDIMDTLMDHQNYT